MAAEGSLPDRVVEEIVDRADGVPLFIEELTKAMLEAGAAEAAVTAARVLPARMAVPATLHASLMARLDRLGPAAREVAQVGAAIGREFSHELLAALAGRDAAELDGALDQLTSAGLLFRHGTGREARFLFKHALVRDAAYGTLLREPRRQLHASIARTLEERFPERVAAGPELVAHHLAEAGLAEQAVEYWWQAGQLASQRSALTEANKHFEAALRLLATLPETAAHADRRLEILTAQGAALISAKGQAAAETGQVYSDALDLCRKLGDGRRLTPLLFGRWVFHMVRAEHAAAQDLATELLGFGQQTGEAAGRSTRQLVAHRAAGIGSLWRGDLVDALDHLEQALALYEPERHGRLASVYAYDLQLAGFAGLAFVRLQLGYPEQAVACCHEAIDAAARQSHPAGSAYVLYHACMLDQIRGDVQGVEQRAEALAALAAEHGFVMWQAAGTAFGGWVLAEHGRANDGIAQIEAGLDAYRATGASLFVPYFLALLGTKRGATGLPADGMGLLARALQIVGATGERWFEPELHRLKGELLLSLHRDATELAERSFLEALSVARSVGAKFLELRASKQPRPVVVRAGSAQRGPRSAGTYLCLVHRGL